MSPRLIELHDYWRAKSGIRPMPDRTDIDPIDFPAILPFVSLWDILGGGGFFCRVWGTQLASRLGFDWTGKTLAALAFDRPNELVVEGFQKTASDGLPVYLEKQPDWVSECNLFIQLLLPLARGNAAPGQILTVADFL